MNVEKGIRLNPPNQTSTFQPTGKKSERRSIASFLVKKVRKMGERNRNPALAEVGLRETSQRGPQKPKKKVFHQMKKTERKAVLTSSTSGEEGEREKKNKYGPSGTIR